MKSKKNTASMCYNRFANLKVFRGRKDDTLVTCTSTYNARIRPSLNRDLGRHNLSSIYDKFIQSSVTMKTTRNGAKEASEGTDF